MAGAREILFDSVKALERQTAGLHILSPYACSTAPKEHILYEILGKVLELVGADAGSIILADETGGVFDFVTLRWTNLPALQITAKEKALRLFRVPLTEGIVGQVYQTREPVILPDVSKSQTFRKDMADAVNYHVHNLLAVPIQTESHRVGVLELFNKTPRGTFSAQDMELAVGLAHQIALVLDVLRVREMGSPSGPPAPPAPPMPPAGVSPEELVEARRLARDAQAQLRETQILLETAMQAKDQSARRVQTLTEELEQVKSLAEAATPPQQILRLLHSVEPFAFTLSLETVLKNFAELSARLVNAQALQLFLWDEPKACFTHGLTTGSAAFGKTVPPTFKIGEGVAGHAADRMELVQIEDVTRDDHFSKSIDEVPGILSRSILAGPLVANGRLVGVIEAINRKDGRPFSSDDGVALAGLALLGAAAVDKVLTHQNVQETARVVLGAVADLIETREVSVHGRAERLRRTVLVAAEALNMTPQDRRDTEWATLLFNVGKVILPAEVLFKQGDLLPKDRELLMSVPRLSSEILASAALLAGTARIVRHVHERWDGQGGPDKLAGEKIPLGARVIAVFDAYDGLTSGGQGRRSLPTDVALKEIETCAGKQFDPACVTLLLRLVREGKLAA
jgi:HD-GYP domain-containing protein (c-di-GMP phosphodiesterase class II)